MLDGGEAIISTEVALGGVTIIVADTDGDRGCATGLVAPNQALQAWQKQSL